MVNILLSILEQKLIVASLHMFYVLNMSSNSNTLVTIPHFLFFFFFIDLMTKVDGHLGFFQQRPNFIDMFDNKKC